jgi:hypothetical protein
VASGVVVSFHMSVECSVEGKAAVDILWSMVVKETVDVAAISLVPVDGGTVVVGTVSVIVAIVAVALYTIVGVLIGVDAVVVGTVSVVSAIDGMYVVDDVCCGARELA